MTTNLIKNPSFETNTTGWTATNGTLAQSSTFAYSGTKSLRVTAVAAGDITVYTTTGTAGIPVKASTTYGYQYRVRAGTTTRFADVGYQCFNAAGTALTTTVTTNGWSATSASFVRCALEATSDGTAAFVSMRIVIRAAAAGEIFYIDAAMVEQGSTSITYYDGDTANCIWNGTAHASTSSTKATYVAEPDAMDFLHLDIEVPTTGTPNLVQNTSGEKGAWGWLTPVANTNLVNPGLQYPYRVNSLRFTSSATQAAYVTTEFMPGVAGRYYGARWSLYSSTGSPANQKARFEFYNSSKVLISSGAQTAAIYDTNTQLPVYLGATLAPAGTTYVKFRIDFYGDAASGPIGPGFQFGFFDVMVTHAATAAAIGTTRTNLVTNPSFETNTTNYSNGSSATLARVTTQFAVGTASMSATCNASGVSKMVINMDTAGVPYIPVTPGKTYTIQYRAKPGTTARNVQTSVRYYNASKVLTGSIQNLGTKPEDLESAGAWKTYTRTFTAPTDCYFVTPQINVLSPALNEVHYIDAVLMEQASTLGGYFDGSTATAGTKTYGWSGTAHASTSIETSGASYDLVEPTTWQNILGPTHDLKISRKELDVGLLSATVLDANLDPTVASYVRPGKKIRVQALANGVWESLFEGKLTNAKVTYEKPKEPGATLTDKGNVRVELTASDNIAHLSNQGESRGVATIAALPYILEGKGVAWNVNGNGNQVTSATIVSSNENASVLDQVAITRDSVLGYVWMSREGVITAYDKTSMPSTPVATFSDVSDSADGWFSYTDIDVDFNTDQCINDVTVKWLRYTTATGTEEITYSGYSDQTSKDTWGARSATFTIHGASESPSAIATYANSILTANATPVIKANSLRMPVRYGRERILASTLDLYDLVTVNYDTKVSSNYRVTGMTHTISPGRWDVDLEFGVDQSVAAPTWTPSPPTGTIITNAWQFPTLLNTWSNYAAGHVPARYRLCPDGTVEVQGLIKAGTVSSGTTGNAFVLPVGYRPDTEMIFNTMASGGPARVDVFADGSVRVMSLVSPATNAYVALNFTFTPAGAA